jgi:predicted AlkP superfamily pyrophosphatase or phosphodiesterase
MRMFHIALAVTLPAFQAPLAAQRPTLVVHVTVDQLRPDYISRWHAQMRGALSLFWNEGAFFVNGFQDHANTETAPGHSVLLSGRFPYSTGILANAVGVETPDYPLVDFPGTGAAPFRFQGTTLADWMTARDPGTRVLSVSRKDRGAILPVARAKTHTVLWYAPRAGRFTTSVWYADTLPAWVREFNAERGVFALAGRAWNLLLPESGYPEPDSVVGEPRADGVFPHVVPVDSQRLATGAQNTPWMDSLTLALAWRGVRAMGLGGADDRTDLLAISLSSTDAIGHRWGPDSRELHDQVLRVDLWLGQFLDSLFALRGRDRVVVTLSADHGVAPIPEVASTFENNRGALRIPSATFRPAVSAARAAAQASGADSTSLRWDDLVLYIDRNKSGSALLDATPIVRTFVESVRGLPGVMRVDVIDDLTDADTTHDVIARRLLHMFRPGRDSYPGIRALVAVTLAPMTALGQADQATHGTPHDYDARVPVAFLGPRFVSGLYEQKIAVADIAPTLAAVLGVPPTESLDGRVLREILRR